MRSRLTACLLLLASGAASAHGTAENPVAPPNLSGAIVVQRLTMLGYTDVRIVRETADAADVELSRASERYALTVSKKLTGPDTLTTTDVAQVVQARLKPMTRPTGVVIPGPAPSPVLPR